MSIEVNETDTITVKELAEAISRVDHEPSEFGVALAFEYARDIKAHREPEYESGHAYIDANNEIWLRAPHTPGWYRPGYAAWYPHNRPVRPLRKLVPES